MFKFFNKILVNNENDKYILKNDEGKDYNKFINNTGFNVFISLCFIICVFSIFIISAQKQETEFFIVDPIKKEIKLLPTYSEPIISSNALEDWATNSTLKIFTFNFTNTDTHFEKMKIFFTAQGFSGFMNSMNKSGLITSVEDSSLEVFITPLEKAIITYIGGNKSENHRSWNIEIKAFISYMGTSTPKNEKVIVYLVVEQVPTYMNPNGIAISSLKLIRI